MHDDKLPGNCRTSVGTHTAALLDSVKVKEGFGIGFIRRES
jgi:hypothetical protein